MIAAADSGAAVLGAARNLLAWEDIDDDEDTKNRVDEPQLALLKRNLANAKRDLDEAIFRTYRHVYLLGKDNKLQHVDLGQITSSSAAKLENSKGKLRDHWYEGNLRDLAKGVGFEDEYVLLQKHLSGVVRSSAYALTGAENAETSHTKTLPLAPLPASNNVE